MEFKEGDLIVSNNKSIRDQYPNNSCTYDQLFDNNVQFERAFFDADGVAESDYKDICSSTASKDNCSWVSFSGRHESFIPAENITFFNEPETKETQKEYSSGSQESPDYSKSAGDEEINPNGFSNFINKLEKNHNMYVYTYGSSKGGSGKTFTCMMSAYRYAKNNPFEKVCIVDLDIIDGQIGTSILQKSPNIYDFYKLWTKGLSTSTDLLSCKINSPMFPPNLDFYLGVPDFYVNKANFWSDFFNCLAQNYDTCFFDTGIDYRNYPQIRAAYHMADKIILTTTTDLNSITSVSLQISRLGGGPGAINNNGVKVYTKEDGLLDKITVCITRADPNDLETNNIVMGIFSANNKQVKIGAIFPNTYQKKIADAQYRRKWNGFDNEKAWNSKIDALLERE